MRIEKDLNSYSFKNLLLEAWVAFTDFERRYFYTLKELFIRPEKVVQCYIQFDRERYFPVVKYFIVTMFMSYLISSLFQVNAVDSKYYQSIFSTLSESLAQKNPPAVINEGQFRTFYNEYLNALNSMFKFIGVLVVVSLIMPIKWLLRNSNVSFVSVLLISIFGASQITIINTVTLSSSYFFFIPYFVFYYIPAFFFMGYYLYRIARQNQIKSKLRVFIATSLSILLVLVLTMSLGIALVLQMNTRLDSFVTALSQI
jgi:hypothetical protein